MHLLLIHQAFVGPNEAGGTRHFELSRRLRSNGDLVTVVTSNVQYLEGKSTRKSKRFVKEENIEGVRVLRAYAYPVLHKSFAIRVLSFISFTFSSFFAAVKKPRADIYMGTSPPLFQAVSAWLSARINRGFYLLEIRDLWPAFAIDMGVLTNPVLIKLSQWLEKRLYQAADHFLINSPAYRDYLIAKGISPERITLIPNGVDTRAFNPNSRGQKFRSKWGVQNKFVVTYAGALGLANDLATVLRAAERLRDQKGIHFLLVGDGKLRSSLEEQARQLKLPNVTFTGTVTKNQIPEVLAGSDACLAILQDIPMFRTTYPNKVFDYMAAGRPTILAIDGVIRQVVEKSKGGVFVTPGNDVALAKSVQELASNSVKAREMGQQAREYVEEHFDREQQATEFYNLIYNLSTGLCET